jgi:uncharacterized membrane protein
MRPLGWRPVTAFVLSLIGLGLAAFLTWGHYFDQAAISRSCSMTFGSVSHGVINCGAVTTSSWSSIFGVPVALYGLVFFVFMTGILSPVAWRSPSLNIARLRLAASIAGVVMVVYLVGVEALAIHAICIYCTGIHIAMFAIFLIVATGWQETGWARFVDAYDEEVARQEERRAREEAREEALVVNEAAASRRTPRASRSERKRVATRQ